jgi:hypothetical protein
MECVTKEIIDNYYTKNERKLHSIANNILTNVNKTELADTLVSESYMYIIEKEETLRGLILKGKLESIVVNFMNKQIKWCGTKFKKVFIDDHSNVEYYDENDYDDIEDLTDYDELLEQEFIHQDKVAHIAAKYQELDVPNRILYDLAIVGEYNTSGKLAKYLNLNRTTAYYLIRTLKRHLRDGYNNEE